MSSRCMSIGRTVLHWRMFEWSNVLFIYCVENKIAESSYRGLVFHKLILLECELTGRFDLSFVGGSIACSEARI